VWWWAPRGILGDNRSHILQSRCACSVPLKSTRCGSVTFVGAGWSHLLRAASCKVSETCLWALLLLKARGSPVSAARCGARLGHMFPFTTDRLFPAPGCGVLTSPLSRLTGVCWLHPCTTVGEGRWVWSKGVEDLPAALLAVACLGWRWTRHAVPGAAFGWCRCTRIRAGMGPWSQPFAVAKRARRACVYQYTPFSPPGHPTAPWHLSLSPKLLSPLPRELAQEMRLSSQGAAAERPPAGPTPSEGRGHAALRTGPPSGRCPRAPFPTFSQACFCASLTVSLFATTTTKSQES